MRMRDEQFNGPPLIASLSVELPELIVIQGLANSKLAYLRFVDGVVGNILI